MKATTTLILLICFSVFVSAQVNLVLNRSLESADVSGRIVKTIFVWNNSTGVTEINFSIADFSKGIYFLTLSNSTGNFVKRLVVE